VDRGGGVSLKACNSCMSVRYCNAICQHKHWPKHKAACKLRAAEIRDEALFKDPPSKEDCPICFLPMPTLLISCVTRLDCPYQSTTSQLLMWGWLKWQRKSIIHVAGKAFAKGASIPSVNLVMISVPIATPTKIEKRAMSRLKII
jgi:hypothetical protein